MDSDLDTKPGSNVAHFVSSSENVSDKWTTIYLKDHSCIYLITRGNIHLYCILAFCASSVIFDQRQTKLLCVSEVSLYYFYQIQNEYQNPSCNDTKMNTILLKFQLV